MLKDFERQLPALIAGDFNQARHGVPGVVDDLSGFKVGTKLCYKIAKDRIRGTNDFQEACHSVMNRPVIQPCLHANQVAADALATLELRLKERLMRYSAEVAALCATDTGMTTELDLQQLENAVVSFHDSVSENAMKEVGAAIGVAFEVMFFRQSCSYIAKLFAKPAAKIAGSAAAAGICAVADGPLPIGDAVGAVIAIGSLGWTAYDIYDVTCVMPKRLKKELYRGIDETEQKLLEQKQAEAQQLREMVQNSISALQTELNSRL